MVNSNVTFNSILEASKRLEGKIVRTPILQSKYINEKLESNIFLKAENLQTIGAFKFRGAMNSILQLPSDIKKVVAWSSGNHAQAVAAASKITGRQATIVMPKDSPKAKLNGTAFWGATIIKYDRNIENREEIGKKIAKNINAKIIPPFDDDKVIIGQGTAGIECIEQLNEINVTPDIVLCCCGGGGLIAGISTAIKEKFQNVFNAKYEDNIENAIKSLSLKENDMLIITGSLYLAGEILNLN